MVVYTSGSSPKKRRMDEAPRTAQQVAETNATLTMFTNKRQNKWMHNLGTASTGEGAIQPAAGRRDSAENGSYDPVGRGNIRATDDGHGNIQAESRWGSTRPVDNSVYQQSPNARQNGTLALNLNTRAGQSSRMEPGLVDYQSPYAAHTQVPTPLTAAAALHSRPASAGGPRPGLPSPAPSDEHANPPVTHAVIPSDPETTQPGPPRVPVRRPRGRPRKHPLGGGVFHAQSPVASPQSAVVVPNTPSQLPSSTRVPTPTSNLASVQLRSNSLAHAANSALSPQQNMQSMSSRNHGLYDVGRMQQRIDDFFGAQGRTFNPVDEGRKALAQEALQKEDYFYLALSQVFCLYNSDRGSLPPQLEKVPSDSWLSLERLLGSNQALTPAVLKWFAEFPAPLHIIAASGESTFFVNQLVVIESFLTELPRCWNDMIASSTSRLAPPLTQDLVEQLYLISPVVQTTAFRAIARAFWGENNGGLQVVESLHQIDQHTYTYQQRRRTAAEKHAAYSIYAQIYHAWKLYCTQPERLETAFVPSPAWSHFFQQPPPSMKQVSGTSGAHQQYSRGAAQQIQLMEANQRILAQQQQAVPGLTPTQQRDILQSNNRTIAHRHGLEPNPLNSLQYPPNATPQPRPAHQHLPHILPSNSATATPLQGGPHMAPHMISHTPQRLAPGFPTPGVPAPYLSRLLPPDNAFSRPLPVQPDTARVSLHQAHLRSPLPGYQKLSSGKGPLYRHVIGYALPPTRLEPVLCSQTIVVSLPEAQFDKVPITKPGMLPGEPGVRILEEGSLLYRLRCSKMPPGRGFASETSWVTADNVWADDMSFELNGKHLEARRRLHFGRYLPIDLSPYICVGNNTLNVYKLPNRRDTTVYVVAIEMVGASSHSRIVTSTPTISSADSLSAIKQSLAGTADDDDEIAMTSSNLTIPLFDPYRADRICDTPVRGSACLHRECFDLETFLSQCKREQPGHPCVPDCWRCPICKGDVRPQTLVKDGFLMQVKQELEAKNLLNTRAIIVEADGCWKPRVEAKASGVRSASLEREEATSAATAATANVTSCGGKGKQKVVEVIELD